MLRDDDLTARTADPDFWPLYLFDDEAVDAYDEAREDEEGEGEVLRSEFRLPHGLALELEFDPGANYVNLAVLSPEAAEPQTVGWDDMAHFHPHAMTWSELDLLCRAAALHEPALRHPGPMLALLLRFAFLSEDEDPDAITPLVDAAFTAVRPIPGATGVRTETSDWLDLRDLRDAGIEWTTRPEGCRAVTQRADDAMPLYSLRAPDADDFPFAIWSRLLARATELLDAARTDPALDAPEVQTCLARCTEPDGRSHLTPLATALSRAGFAHTALLRALSRPASPMEAAWAVETLAGLKQGELIAAWSAADTTGA
ncbi:hypothetical protein OG357_22850 [Streptomyces sp. NBC_01255]|uniref:hypothetical protein n=1 Tax=Streptomyces sp. NBC_01255 TaxID=2903798 RepID=UPI002E31739A|nr:hypothetical protein [Streptomyces sp. NBC_01255]